MKNGRKKRNKKATNDMAMPAPTRKSVDIKKANNGFVVSSWGTKGEMCFVTKTKDEAKRFATKLLGV